MCPHDTHVCVSKAEGEQGALVFVSEGWWGIFSSLPKELWGLALPTGDCLQESPVWMGFLLPGALRGAILLSVSALFLLELFISPLNLLLPTASTQLDCKRGSLKCSLLYPNDTAILGSWVTRTQPKAFSATAVGSSEAFL